MVVGSSIILSERRYVMKKIRFNFHSLLMYVVPYESSIRTRFLKRQRGAVNDFRRIPIDQCTDDIE